MNTADWLTSTFRAKHQAALQQEIAAAADLKADMESLLSHPGWKRLCDTLTRTRDLLYRKLEDGTATDAERAFAKLARQVCEGPSAILAQADSILQDAARNRPGA